MGVMRRFLPLLLLSACSGEAVPADAYRNQITAERAEPGAVDPGEVPVRIGELGPNFAACAAAGTPRHVDASGLPVRAAPFETADQTGRVAPGTSFFLCSRTLDQRWLGIVWEDGGALSPACGVSQPITDRRTYGGPCRSGWVPSAFVKAVAG